MTRLRPIMRDLGTAVIRPLRYPGRVGLCGLMMSRSRECFIGSTNVDVERDEVRVLKLIAYDIHTYFTAVHVHVLMSTWLMCTDRVEENTST